MKKIVIYFSCFVLIFFIFPMLFSKRDKDVITDTSEQLQSQEENTNQDLSNKEQAENQGEYEYKQYGTLQLLHSKTGEVETVKLDEYLCNVVSAEMPADYELEALNIKLIIKNMIIAIFVMILLVVKHGFLKRIGLLDGKRI